MSKKICAHCGTMGDTKREAKGSLLGEVLLWIVMIIIGPYTLWVSVIIAVVFSLWRAIDKKTICNACGKDELVDTSSPKGKKLIEEYHPGK